MLDLTPVIVAPTVLFLLVVAPIWIVMHYRAKGRSTAALTEEERAELSRLSEAAAGMHERIETLESILDTETPEWRGAHRPATRRPGADREQA